MTRGYPNNTKYPAHSHARKASLALAQGERSGSIIPVDGDGNEAKKYVSALKGSNNTWACRQAGIGTDFAGVPYLKAAASQPHSKAIQARPALLN